jgi:hypothetical protein
VAADRVELMEYTIFLLAGAMTIYIPVLPRATSASLDIQWSADGKYAHFTVPKQGNFTIPRGTYIQSQVTARNFLFDSSLSSAARYRLIGIPSTPQINTTSETEDGIFITWLHPSDPGYGDASVELLTSYKLDATVCEAGSCVTSSKCIMNGQEAFNTTSYLLGPDMLPLASVTYTISIQARNSFGWSSLATVQQDYK